MKKILLISLVTILAVGLVGCNDNNDVEVNNPDVSISGEINNEENNQEIENPDMPEIDESGNLNGSEEENISGELSGENASGEFEDEPIVKSELEIKIDNLVQKSNVQVRMPMPMEIVAESSQTYIGLTEAQFTENVKSAIAYESMIMPSNFSLCLVELNDGANVADIKKAIIDNCDLNKWICAWADKAIAVDSGKYIMLVMSTAEDCDALQQAFADEFGTVGEVLSKDNQ